MYIEEVIEQARAYSPSEYGKREMLVWCNEVSAMLAVEDRIVYKEKTLPQARDGSVLLPEGIEFENVVRVYIGTKELSKTAYGGADRRLYIPQDAGFNTPENSNSNTVKIVYEAAYEPIRMPKYNGEITTDAEQGTIKLCDNEFIPGDTLTITADNTTHTGIYLLEAEYDPENMRGYILHASGIPSALDGTKTASVTRKITDKTVCAEPYDTMYVDYILAKIALYQKDNQTYALYMNQFNTKLAQYKQWLTSRIPHEPAVLRNWW